LTEQEKLAIKENYELLGDELRAARQEKQLEKDKEFAEREREAQNEIDALEIERKREAGENTLALELELLERKRIQELDNEELTATQKEEVNKRYSAIKLKLIKKTEEAEAAANRANVQSGLNAAAEIFGFQKELALAQQLMAAPGAIGNVWEQAAKKPTIPQTIAHGVLGTATVLAPIVKSIKDIKSVRFSKAKGGGGTGGGASVSSAPTTTAIGDISATNAARLGGDSNLSGATSAEASANVVGGASSNIVFSENAYNNFQNQVGFRESQSTI